MKKTLLLFAALLALLCTSCEKVYTSESFFAMDTYISIKADGADSALLEKIKNEVYADEIGFSRTFSTGEIYAVNSTPHGGKVSEETAELLSRSLEISSATGGAFSPTMGTLVDLWDIKNENPRVPDESEISNVLADCNASDIELSGNTVIKKNPDTKIDLGGIAKGYSAGKCIELLKEGGVENALISFGGSIACLGNAEGRADGWNIGIKNPYNTDEIIGSVRISDCYLSVSGAYERYFEVDSKRYHHIIDPKTGYPASSDIESSAVISTDGTLTDALSTALFVLGKEKALELYRSGALDFEAVLVLNDGSICVTDGLADIFDFNTDASYKDGNKLVYNSTK